MRVHRAAVRQFLSSVFVLASAVTVLSFAEFSQAQSPGAKSAQTNASPAKLLIHKSPSNGSSERGLNTAIKVHGHWVIDVKNPDGRLVTHREFENSLISSGTAANGAQLLAALLGRVVSSGSWLISLQGNSSGQTGVVFITESSSDMTALCTGEQNLFSSEGFPFSCSNSLSLTAPSGNSFQSLTGQTLTLIGSGTVPNSFAPSITYVETDVLACAPSDTPASCTTDPNFRQMDFTSRNLDGQNGDPAAVAVTPGQTVTATVVISFQ